MLIKTKREKKQEVKLLSIQKNMSDNFVIK